MKYTIILLYLLGTINLYSQSQKNEYLIDNVEYSLKYFPGWKLNTSLKGADFYLFTEKENKEDLFFENVNLLIQDLKGLQINLDRFVDISESQIKSYNGTLISSARKKADDREFQDLVFEASMNGYKCKLFQRYFLKNEKAYILTYTAEENSYLKFEKSAMEILNSFSLK